MDTNTIIFCAIVLIAAIFGFFIGAAWGINKSGMLVYNDMKELAQSYNKAYSDLINVVNALPPIKQPEHFDLPTDIPEEETYDTGLSGGVLG